MSEQHDPCKGCTVRGDLPVCLVTRCSQHDGWYALELKREIDRLRADSERYRWLSPRLLAADFDWNETGECVLVFSWPKNIGVGGNCDKNIDAAMKEAP